MKTTAIDSYAATYKCDMNNNQGFKVLQIYFEDDDETETYRLVTTVRGSSINGLISIDSPMGKALLGHKVGERVYIKVNDQYGYYVEIKSIENTQDDSQDKLRTF